MPNPRKPTTGPSRNLAAGTQCATFWLDESGSKSTSSKCFVVAGIKTRHPDDLQREIQSVRDTHDFRTEFKFGRMSARSYRVFADLVDVLESSDAMVTATVVDARYNPFKGKDHWRAHAGIVAQLVIGNINRNEVAVVFMDGITTPRGSSLGRVVKQEVNRRLGATVVTTAVSLDSRSNDLLQAADLIAGTIFFERMMSQGGSAKPDKVKIAQRVALAFGAKDLSDQRTDRVNIRSMRGPRGGGNVHDLARDRNVS